MRWIQTQLTALIVLLKSWKHALRKLLQILLKIASCQGNWRREVYARSIKNEEEQMSHFINVMERIIRKNLIGIPRRKRPTEWYQWFSTKFLITFSISWYGTIYSDLDVDGKLVEWLRDRLKDGNQAVMVNGATSMTSVSQITIIISLAVDMKVSLKIQKKTGDVTRTAGIELNSQMA